MSIPLPLSSRLEQVVSYFGARRSGSAYIARCPVHGDNDPSMKIEEGHTSIMLTCWSRHCSFDSIIATCPDDIKDAILGGEKKTNVRIMPNRQVVATWEYSRAGEHRYRKVRYSNKPNGKKDMAFQKWDGEKWAAGKPKDCPVFFYNQDSFDFYKDSKIVVIAEGEKNADDVNRVAGDLYVAITNDGGAGNWTPEHSALLSGCRIVILEDNDPVDAKTGSCPGPDRTRRIVNLGGYKELLGVLRFTDAEVGEKGDVSDWLERGATKEQLLERLEKGLTKPDLSIPDVVRLTDTGNADRFIKLHADNAKYCEELKSWLVWNGQRWEINNNRPTVLAKDVARLLFKEAAETKGDNSKDLAKWGLQCESHQKIKAMLALAQPEPEISVKIESIDSNPYLITVLNGTLSLGHGRVELLPHSPSHFITKQVQVEYDASESSLNLAPHWHEFLETIFNGNQELISFIQRAVGYSLSGDVGERKIFVLHGAGKNGKSTFVNTIAALLGADYSNRIPTSTLEIKKGEPIPTDIAGLKGIRFAYASETKEGRQLDEAMVKDITGGETLSARFMRGDFFNFKPQFKVWLSTNAKPVIQGTDDAIWDRICLIPFEHRFSEKEMILNFSDTLKDEFPGILKWAVEGFMQWRSSGLNPPQIVINAVKEYRNESNLLEEFVKNCLEFKTSISYTVRVKTSEVFDAFNEYVGGKSMSPQAFNKLFSKVTGLQKVMGGGKYTYWQGVQFKEENLD